MSGTSASGGAAAAIDTCCCYDEHCCNLCTAYGVASASSCCDSSPATATLHARFSPYLPSRPPACLALFSPLHALQIHDETGWRMMQRRVEAVRVTKLRRCLTKMLLQKDLATQ
eukprot:2064686-Pleurochrysis_carterae.AAC.4